jgi:hypothetical protein
VLERTRRLWDTQFRSVGDRRPLFDAVADAASATSVLYAGSYVDLTPAFVWPEVTFLDVDRRARRFFDDAEGVAELIAEHDPRPGPHRVEFVHGDYTEPIDLADESFDLLVSLYAGFVSEHCTRHLRVGGYLLANSSHGDAAMASIDPRYRFAAAVTFVDGRARVRTDDLDTYLVPKRPVDVTVDSLHESGRGVAYIRPCFAYLFRRTR